MKKLAECHVIILIIKMIMITVIFNNNNNNLYLFGKDMHLVILPIEVLLYINKIYNITKYY